jgi:hypothetical protein
MHYNPHNYNFDRLFWYSQEITCHYLPIFLTVRPAYAGQPVRSDYARWLHTRIAPQRQLQRPRSAEARWGYGSPALGAA